MIRGIDHVAVPARDYAAAARFYQTVLGFTLYSEKALGGDPPRRIGYLRPPAGGTVHRLGDCLSLLDSFKPVSV